jgi:hypothetical protein
VKRALSMLALLPGLAATAVLGDCAQPSDRDAMHPGVSLCGAIAEHSLAGSITSCSHGLCWTEPTGHQSMLKSSDSKAPSAPAVDREEAPWLAAETGATGPAAAFAPGSRYTAPAKDRPMAGEGAAPRGQGATKAQFGTQKLAYQSLIHSDRDRSGAVAAWQPLSQTDVRGFVFHPEIAAESRRPARSADEEQQLLGIVVEHSIAQGAIGTWTLTGGWVAASELPDPAGPGTQTPATSAWSLGTNASTLMERLRLSFEYAGSEPDRDRPGTTGGTQAQAYRVGAELHPAPSSGEGWHVGSEYRWVGQRFDSVANSDLKPDHQRLRGYGGLDVGDLRFQLSVRRDRNNLALDPAKPTRQADQFQATTTWQPANPGPFKVLGEPRFRLDAVLGHDQIEAVTAPGPRMERSEKLQLGADFKTTGSRWGAKATHDQAPGKIDASTGAGIRGFGLELHHQQTARPFLPVRKDLQWQRREDLATATIEQRWQARLRSTNVSLHERMNGEFDLRYQERVTSPGNGREASVNLAGQLVWTMQTPAATRNGLAIALSADYPGASSQASARRPEDGYQVMLTLSTSNPLAGW